MNVMKFVRASVAAGLWVAVVARAGVAGAAGPATLPATAAALPATRPAAITLHVRDMPARKLIDDLAKQAGAAIPVFPPDLLEQNPLPPVTLDVDRQPFWTALEEIGRKTGLEPIASPDDPYPRLLLGLAGGGFWQEPHAVGGPLVIFANEIERNHSVELRRSTPGEFERRVTVNLTAFAEPGLRILSASPGVKVTAALDEAGHRLNPTPGDPEAPDFSPASNPGNGLYAWNLAVVLDAPPAGARSIATLAGVTHVRVQTGSERVEIDAVMKQRNLTRTVAGVPFTIKSLKKVDIEYLLQLSLRREKKREVEWQNLHGSIYNGRMALYDDKGRLVAGRATENGGDYGDRKIESTLRFVREPGVSDPKAGEPYKLVWLAPTQSKDLTVPFELVDLPIPE
jgi:hypothetical protein